MFKDLVFNQWRTKLTEGKTDSLGKASFEGFLGEYKYTIKSGDKMRTGTFKIDHSKKSGKENVVLLSFDSNLPDRVEISADKPAFLCEGENIALKTANLEGLTYEWLLNDTLLSEQTATLDTDKAGFYTVKISNGNITVTSEPFELVVNPLPEANIDVLGDLYFCPGGEVNLEARVPKNASYQWLSGTTRIEGSVTTLSVNQTGSYFLEATANGCKTKSERVGVRVYSPNDPNCVTGIEENNLKIKVYPNPFNGSFVIEKSISNKEDIKAELYNALGALVKHIKIDNFSGKTIIHVDNPGLYTLRLTDGKDVKIFKLIGN